MTNETQARDACLTKWREIRTLAAELGNWTSRTCGFCYLANSRHVAGSGSRCRECPGEVKKFCDKLLDPMNGIVCGLEDKVREVISFLRKFEVTDGSEEVPEGESS